MINENDIFYPLKDWEGYYEINKIGVVKSVTRWQLDNRGANKPYKGKVLSTSIRFGGYKFYKLQSKELGKKSSVYVHRLLAIQFIPNPDNLPQVNHINGIRTDNSLNNLEWCDSSYNNTHKFKIGYISPRRQSKENILDIYYSTILKRDSFVRYGTIPLEEISKKYNIDNDTVRKIIRKESYKDIVKNLPIVAYYKIQK